MRIIAALVGYAMLIVLVLAFVYYWLIVGVGMR